MRDGSTRDVSGAGRGRSWLRCLETRPQAELVAADSAEEYSPSRARAWSRRSVAICSALGLLSLVAATLPSGPLLQHVSELLQLWSSRRGFNSEALANECAFDAAIGASYLFRGALELAEATQDCPEVDEVKSELYRELREHPSFTGPASGTLPSLVNASPPTLQNASLQVAAACAKAQETLNSLHARRPGLRKNRSFADLAARRLAEKMNIEEVIDTKVNARTFKQLCTSEIAGTIGAWSWVAGYLSSATTECAGMMYLDRYCASDISRTIAALADVVQASSGIAASCPGATKRVRTIEHIKEKVEKVERFKKIIGKERRLDPVVSQLPADPPDQLRFGSRDLNDEEEDEKDVIIEDIKARRKEERLDRIHQGLCTVNAAQGVLFLGRAALEISGAMEHCPDDFDLVERLRCAANSQGAFAAFAVTSHVMAEATAQCQESVGKLNLDGFCAGSSSQIIHATTELTAALCVLAADCTLMVENPNGLPRDQIKAELQKAREMNQATGKFFNDLNRDEEDDRYGILNREAKL